MTAGKTPKRGRRKLLEDEVARWVHAAASRRRAKRAKKKPKKKAAK